MKTERFTLSILPGCFSVCRFSPDSDIPAWGKQGELYSITRSAEELSVVCPSDHVPPHVRAEGDWIAFKVEGPLDFSMSGVLSSLAGPLADAGISIFAISTFNTDYLLIKEKSLRRAIEVLKNRGHKIHNPAFPRRR